MAPKFNGEKEVSGMFLRKGNGTVFAGLSLTQLALLIAIGVALFNFLLPAIKGP